MFEDNTMFAHIVSDLGIQISKVSVPFIKNKDFPDLHLRSNLFGADKPFTEDADFDNEQNTKMTIYLISDDFKCNYILGKQQNDSSSWVIGPFLFGSVDPLEIRRLFEKKGLKTIDFSYLSSYYHGLPVIRDENIMNIIIHAHCVSRFGKESFNIVAIKLRTRDLIETTTSERQSSGYQMERHSIIYARQDLFMLAISEGNYSQAISALRKLEIHDPEQRTANTLRDMKNYSIILNTICRIAAQKGGVSPYDIHKYSGEIARNIENSPNVKELRRQRDRMIENYCSLVKKAAVTNYSYSIRQVTDFIDSHYSEEITLSSTAAIFNMSPANLSSRFHKETGMTFSEYLLDKRIRHAKILIEKTEMTMSMIAEDCGIQDNNYFSRIFKKKEGMTPLEYRNKNRK